MQTQICEFDDLDELRYIALRSGKSFNFFVHIKAVISSNNFTSQLASSLNTSLCNIITPPPPPISFSPDLNCSQKWPGRPLGWGRSPHRLDTILECRNVGS